MRKKIKNVRLDFIARLFYTSSSTQTPNESYKMHVAQLIDLFNPNLFYRKRNFLLMLNACNLTTSYDRIYSLDFWRIFTINNFFLNQIYFNLRHFQLTLLMLDRNADVS